MSKNTYAIVLFACFALGLPIWAMQENGYELRGVHGCTGDCYEQWQAETGGVVQIALAQAAAKAEASPEELGKAAYAQCIACHGAGGEGGIGPALAGSPADAISGALIEYRAGETRGAQSALMWSQSRELSDTDINNLAAYILTF
ncbi:MAG: c-type cytochrome [Pseudomonadota bacterium]